MRVLNTMAARALLLATLCCGTAAGQSMFSNTQWTATLSTTQAFCSHVIDVTGDGTPDMILDSYFQIACLPGPFYNAAIISTHPLASLYGNLRVVAVTDLNGDGFNDAVINVNGSLINMFGNNSGSFVAAPSIPNSQIQAGYTWIGDLNNDGNPELIGRSSPYIAPPVMSTWTNVAGGWVFVGNTPLLGADWHKPVVGDINGDQFPDIVLECWPPSGPKYALVLQNNGNLTFPITQQSIAMSQQQANFAEGVIADINSDGFGDYIFFDGLLLKYFEGNNSCTFSLVSTAPIPPLPAPFIGGGGASSGRFIRVEDFDGDGGLDVLLSVNYSQWFSAANVVFHKYAVLFRNRGSSPFLSSNPFLHYLAGPIPWNDGGDLTVADFDNDGDKDLVVTKCQSCGSANWTVDIGIAWNRSVLGPGVSGSTGTVPTLVHGASYLGNAGFAIGLQGAPPGFPVALGLSLGTSMLGTTAGALWLDLSPGQLLSPSSSFGTYNSGALGMVYVPIPIPSSGIPQGVFVYAQWAVAHPSGTALGGSIPLLLTPAHTLLLWP